MCARLSIVRTPKMAGRLGAAALALGVVLAPSVARGGPPTLRVHGTATIDAHAARDHGTSLVLDGRVLDDGAIAVRTTIRVTVALGAGGATVAPHPTTCGASPKPVPVEGSEIVVATDEGGRFCVTFELEAKTYHVVLSAAETQLVDGAKRDLDVDLSKRSLRLRFDPEPRVVALDGSPLHLDAVVTRDEEVAGTPPWVAGVALTLASESGAPFARATTGPGGRASFDVDRTKLGHPGFGELRLHFDGDADTMASDHRAPVRRDARVTLSLAASLAPSIPEDGITMGILASTIQGAPTSGSLEARVGDVGVGAAPLAGTRTDMTVTFASEETSGVYVKVKYVPDAPYYLAGDDLTVAVPVRGPSPWRKAPLVLCAIAIGAWLLLGRRARRRGDTAKTIVMSRPPIHDGTEGIEVRSEGSPSGPWFGVVIDAHDGAPIPRVRVAIESPSFEGGNAASAFTDEDGKFRIAVAKAPPPGSRIVAEGPLHAALRRSLPRGGELEIALVARKRRILERLVAWAKRRGPPFDQRPEPTPAQVRKAAAAAGPEGAAAAEWADAVERAAFDDSEVDARVEAAIEDLAPPAPPAAGDGKPSPDANHRRR